MAVDAFFSSVFSFISHFGYDMAFNVCCSDAVAVAVAGFRAFESITCTKPFDII